MFQELDSCGDELLHLLSLKKGKYQAGFRRNCLDLMETRLCVIRVIQFREIFAALIMQYIWVKFGTD